MIYWPICKSFSIITMLTLTTHAVADGTFVHLGTGLTAYDSNNNGSVVVGYGTSQYWVWTQATGRVDVGGSVPGNGVGGRPRISSDGTLLTGTRLNPTTNLQEISSYSIPNGIWESFGGLGSSSGGESSSGWGVSDDGTTLVGLGWVTAGSAQAIRWRASTGVVSLGTTVAGRSTRANDCNAGGDVIVGWQDSTSGFRQGAVWVDGVQTLISLSGSPLGEASGVSNDGTWVIGNGVSSNGFNPWRWSRDTGASNLGVPPTAGWQGYATSISGDGSIIIGFYRPFGSPSFFGSGFIWTAATGTVDLNTYAQTQGVVVPADTILALPLAISRDGRTIVGNSRQGNLQNAFILTIAPPPCAGDINQDGAVGGTDLATLLSAWGLVSGTSPADINQDGQVDGTDLTTLLSSWGDCPN